MGMKKKLSKKKKHRGRLNKLYHNIKLEVRKSTIHGYGVFAKDDIKKDELLEECFYMVQPGISQIYNEDYIYSWPKYGKSKYMTVVLGYGSMYNSSKKQNDNNAHYETDEENHIFVFRAIKDIKKDSEILIWYGPDWWKGHKKEGLQEELKNLDSEILKLERNEIIKQQTLNNKRSTNMVYYSENGQVSIGNGDLVRNIKTGKVYLLSGTPGKLLWITSMTVFNRLNYRWGNVIDVTDNTLSNFKLGEPVE